MQQNTIIHLVDNVCSEKKYSKRSSVLLLRLLYFFSERTLCRDVFTIFRRVPTKCVRLREPTFDCSALKGKLIR